MESSSRTNGIEINVIKYILDYGESEIKKLTTEIEKIDNHRQLLDARLQFVQDMIALVTKHGPIIKNLESRKRATMNV
jgi:hypothetical protein